ncbi:MAG: hypothetical protein UY40_C0007G0020 [candidate division CPR1 bacterium GW2011_GWC1_49_13]|uniref:Uncharacterized protein n=1 Tax=candidate division CPR1 bacterium GW2011_GWC1_49_13 TaxID=1618342 RepID=A0A0G1VHE6_9BACT|nr:MAG: hypothetical protein UY40_C0007G0020 [candidate division CPR1 bacterium GW2011_GWC1_49_13]
MNITSSCLKRSLSLAAGFLISVVSLFSGYPLKVPAVWADTANVLPNGQTGDTTGDSLSDVTADDATCDPDALSAVATGDTCYTVDKSVVMLLSSFDTSGIPGGSTITAAVLHFQFGAENGYSGSNPVRYNNGAGLTTTGITPTDIAGWSADQTFDLYGAGVNTLAEIGAVDIEFTSNDGGGPSAVHFDYVWITVTYTPPVNTTLGSGTDPASATAAPGSGIQDAGAFTFQTGTGTDSITALTVILAGAGTPYNGLSEVRVTSNDGATLYFAAISSPSSNTLNFSGGTAIPATTTQTAFKIRVTPKTHANMDGPPGASYDLSPYVSAFTSTNTQAGSDSNANTLTVDNFSPNEATSTGGSAADQQVTLNWTSSNSGDFDTTSGSVVYRWASGSAGAEAPDEGTTPSAGDTDGTATVACVISSAASASLSKIDGSGGSAGCTTVALTNGQQYTYKVFQRDIRGNYDGGVSIGTFTPSSAKFWLELPGQTFTDGVGVTGTATVTANESFSITVYKTDGANNLDASYTGSHTINWTWTATSSPNDNIAPTKPADGAQTFSSGSVTVSGFILTDASETPSITATEPSGPEGDSSTITVNPGSTTKLVITTNPTSTTAGVETSQYIVQRRDAVGNPTTSGTQQVDLSSTSTGGAKQLRDTSGGGGVTFVTIANGVSTENFFYYDEKSGSWTISVSATGKTGDSKALTVDPASASAFTVTTENGGTEVAGTSFSVTLTAKDSFNNTVSSGPNNYTGSHTINWTWTATNSPNDTAPTKPADGAQTFTNGVLTLAGFTLTDSGETPTITGTEPAGPAGTSAAITVQPAGVDSFMVTTESGGTETAGTAFSVTLTAKDSLGNTVSSGVNNYTGAKTINWTWTATNSPNSTAPTKPADGARTFTNGVLTLSGFTLTNAGETPTITATDPNSPNPAGTSAAITVQPGAADSFTVTTQNGGTETANISFSVTLTAKDSLGNTVSSGVNNYTGSKTINWTWTATSSPNDNVAPTKPANGAQTFTNGVLTLAGFTLMDASETPTITATDPNSPNPAGTSAAITVNLGATNKLVITTWPSSVNADTETTQYIIQRRDAVGNPTTSGTQQVDLSSNSTGTYQFRDTSGGGSVTFVTIADTASTENFFYIDNTLGSWTISISFTGLTGDSKPLEVTSDKFWLELPGQIFVDGTGVTGTATVTANGSFSITIYKTDGSKATRSILPPPPPTLPTMILLPRSPALFR